MKSIFSPKSNFKFLNMSKINNNNTKQIYSAKKPCCKVCVDAGKTEKEYSSHYVKDLNGKVTCPTLLNQECRRCHVKGHTTSFCTSKNNIVEENSRKPPISPPKKEVRPPKKSNVFAYLEMNSDDSDNDEEAEQFPELVVAEPKNLLEKEISAPKKFSYASMAAKIQTETKTPFVDKRLEVVIQKVWPDLAPGQKKSWVQLCDEEADSSEDEEVFDEDNSAW
jgi:hypothetical protein